MNFTIPEFTPNLQDFTEMILTFKNVAGDPFVFKVYRLTEPIVLEPTVAIPSFWMLDKNAVSYDKTQFVLIPELRMIIPDPKINYQENQLNIDGGAERPRVDYRQNPFHPYWIGNVTANGNGTLNAKNPNTYAYENLSKLMDVYISVDGNNLASGPKTTHGIRNENTPFNQIPSEGNLTMPNQGSLGEGMFMPVIKKYLQGGAVENTAAGNHYARMVNEPGAARKNATFEYRIYLPETSTDEARPYLLPPMFTDLFSVWHGNGNNYNASSNSSGAISILTFGVR